MSDLASLSPHERIDASLDRVRLLLWHLEEPGAKVTFTVPDIQALAVVESVARTAWERAKGKADTAPENAG